jgi:hypothetical protein
MNCTWRKCHFFNRQAACNISSIFALVIMFILRISLTAGNLPRSGFNQSAFREGQQSQLNQQVQQGRPIHSH